jgi:hypothetical protein
MMMHGTMNVKIHRRVNNMDVIQEGSQDLKIFKCSTV